MQRLEGLLALIEGWVSVVTEDATRNLPKAPQLTKIMARRRIDGGPSEQVFREPGRPGTAPPPVRDTAVLALVRKRPRHRGPRRPLGHPETPAHPAELEDFTASMRA